MREGRGRDVDLQAARPKVSVQIAHKPKKPAALLVAPPLYPERRDDWVRYSG